MSLDPKTIGVGIVALTFLMAMMLALASRQARGMVGVSFWAWGQLAISVGLGLNLLQLLAPPLVPYVLGNSLLFLGMGLTLGGIRLYKNSPPPWRWVAFGTVATFVLATYFTFVDPSVRFRIVYLSLVFGVFSGLCAQELLIPIKQPLRTAYWLTGSGWALLSVFSLLRAFVVALDGGASSDGTYRSDMLTGLVFVSAGIAEVVSTFGFVLMISYRMADTLERLASLDALTGALNRRSLTEQLQRAVSASAGAKARPVAVLMIDIDHFKAINDRYGHPVGDLVLRALCGTARGVLRNGDLLARMGGEEFCIALLDADEERAFEIAERIRETCLVQPPVVASTPIRYTVSVGITAGHLPTQAFENLVAIADEALYHAKRQGRDCVVRSSALALNEASPERRHAYGTWLTQSFIDIQENP